MDEDLMEEERMKELRKKFRFFKVEAMKERAREYKEQGKTKEEVKLMPNMNYLDDEEIDEIFNETDEKDNENEVVEETSGDKGLEDYEVNDEAINIEKIDNEKLEDKVSYSSNSKEENQIVFLEDSQLIDYENQPFVTDVKEDNQELEESIKLNGIIEPIIVRPFNGKYQILSGHRRRMCGRNVGLTQFPCYIREKDDNEAKLYLVDTNLISRKNIKPTERAKAYLLKQEALKDKKIKAKVDKEILTDNSSLREAMEKENNVSKTSIQRYLRINYLNQDLQDAVDDKKITLSMAEQLSFLRKGEQAVISKMINKENKKFSEGQIKKIRQLSNNENFTRENVENLINNRTEEFKVTISFTSDDVKKYFNNERDYKKAREVIMQSLKDSKKSTMDFSVKNEL